MVRWCGNLKEIRVEQTPDVSTCTFPVNERYSANRVSTDAIYRLFQGSYLLSSVQYPQLSQVIDHYVQTKDKIAVATSFVRLLRAVPCQTWEIMCKDIDEYMSTASIIGMVSYSSVFETFK